MHSLFDNIITGEIQQHSELPNGKSNGAHSEDDSSTEYHGPADPSISSSKLSQFDILEKCIEQLGSIIEDPDQVEGSIRVAAFILLPFPPSFTLYNAL